MYFSIKYCHHIHHLLQTNQLDVILNGIQYQMALHLDWCLGVIENLHIIINKLFLSVSVSISVNAPLNRRQMPECELNTGRECLIRTRLIRSST